MFNKDNKEKKAKKQKPWEQDPQTIELPDEYVLEAADTPAPAGPGGYELSTLPPEALDAAIAPPRKKRNPKTFVFLGLALLVVAALVINYIMGAMKGPDPTYTEFHTTQRGDLEQSLATNGTITTGERVTVYSPVNAPVATVGPVVGQPVTKGQPLFTFQTADLEKASRSAGSAYNAGALTAQDSINKSNESQADANEYQQGVQTMQQQRDIAKQRVTDAEAAVEKATQNNAGKLIEAQGHLDTAQAAFNKYGAGGKNGNDDLLNKIDKYTKQVELYSGRISAAQQALAAAQQDLEQHNALISQLETARDTAEAGVLDGTQRAALSEQNVGARLESLSAAELLELARAGISAPISGVVTSLTAEPGALAGQYTALCVIESLEQVDVELHLSRYDLENVKVGQSATVESLGHSYSGSVTQIDSMTTEVTTTAGTSSLVRAVVSLSNPDENITLGLDADVTVHTGSVKDVVIAPLDAVGTDVDGSYVFVITPENIAQRRSITTGMASDTEVEVTEGLTAGEVIATSPQNLTDGIIVSDDPQYMPATDMMAAIM